MDVGKFDASTMSKETKTVQNTDEDVSSFGEPQKQPLTNHTDSGYGNLHQRWHEVAQKAAATYNMTYAAFLEEAAEFLLEFQTNHHHDDNPSPCCIEELAIIPNVVVSPLKAEMLKLGLKPEDWPVVQGPKFIARFL